MSFYATFETFPSERTNKIIDTFRAAEERVWGKDSAHNSMEEMGKLEEDESVTEGAHKSSKHTVMKFAMDLNKEEITALKALGVKLTAVPPNAYKPFWKFK